jgi:hypothetical protein
MAQTFTDIPVRENGQDVVASWFNLLRLAGIDVETIATALGVIFPNLTTTERDAITTPSNGQTIMNTTLDKVQTYKTSSSAWVGLGGGAGGSSLMWHDGDSNTPFETTEFNILVRKFLDDGSQVLPATYVVPSSYTAGGQIKLRALIYGENASSDLLLSATTTLIRAETDALSSTTNQHSSTNTTETITTANVPYTIDIDLTDASGEINSVAVSAGDILKIELSRGTDTDSDALRFIQFATDIII